MFDGVGWTSPKLSSFFESVTERAPVWICARSEHPWDIGHFWPLLARFARVEVRPFHPSETQALVEAAVAAGAVPACDARDCGMAAAPVRRKPACVAGTV